MKFLAVLFLIAVVSAQEPFNSVEFSNTWPQNTERLGGAEGSLAMKGSIGLQGCRVTLPTPVQFIHFYNAMFNADTKSDGTIYEITTAVWANASTSIAFVLNFMNGTDGEAMAFNATDMKMTCGEEPAQLSVASTIVDDDQASQQLQVQNTECFLKGDSIQVTFPYAVKNVTVDTRINGTYVQPEDLSSGVTSLFVIDFNDAVENDDWTCEGDQNKLFNGHFTFTDRKNRFSADQIVVSIAKANVEE